VILTKGGHGPGHLLPAENLAQELADELDVSLDCLRTDHVDLYMLHRDNPAVAVAEIMDCLNAEIERGRLRAIGVSNWECDRVSAANDYAAQRGLRGLVAVSNNISLAVPTGPFYPGLVSVDADGEAWHAETGVPLIPWSAQARGFFTGRYAPELRDAPDAAADGFTARMMEVYGTDENFERLRRAADLGAQKGGRSAVEVALAWVLHRPFQIAPIVGPHTREELASCIAALSLELSDAELRWLNLEE